MSDQTPDNLRRFHVADLGGEEAALSGAEAHHALHVVRVSEGEAVELFDGRGHSAVGRVISAGRKDVIVRIERRNPPAERPRPAVHLHFATPKGKRVDWLLEKATELAATSLRPTEFARSVAGGRGSPARRQRWITQLISAAKQCGLNFLPELHDPAGLDERLGALRDSGHLKLLGDAGDAARPLADALADWSGQEIHLLIGPEGGLSDEERNAAVEAGFAPARLGQTMLRVETAAVAMLAGVTALADRVAGEETA